MGYVMIILDYCYYHGSQNNLFYDFANEEVEKLRIYELTNYGERLIFETEMEFNVQEDLYLNVPVTDRFTKIRIEASDDVIETVVESGKLYSMRNIYGYAEFFEGNNVLSIEDEENDEDEYDDVEGENEK
jgi:hypothetical protein